MPVSSSVQISDCLAYIVQLQPKSVLDIGCGFGLWGFLCREYLDVWNMRVQPEDWEARIDGVEMWEPYIQPHQRYLYNNIYIGDVREVLPQLGEYDLIIAGDVIEHLDKPDAERVIEQLYDKARMALLVNIPLTGNWDHPIQHGNPGELHRSQWTVDDFAAYPANFTEYKLPCGEYGSFLCRKICSPADRAGHLMLAAQSASDRGDDAKAEHLLRRALQINPADDSVVLQLADVLIRAKNLAGAVEALRANLAVAPAFHYARLVLARLLLALGDRPGAAIELTTLCATPDLDIELRGQANALLQKVGG